MAQRITSQFFIALIAIATCLLGCRKATPTLPPIQQGPTTLSSAPEAYKMPASRAHTDVLHVATTPREAAQVVTRVFLKFQFSRDGDMPESGVINDGNDDRVVGDHFSSHTTAKTIDGIYLDADCRWVREDATDVRLQSDLPADQHAVVLDSIKKAFAEAATQPNEDGTQGGGGGLFENRQCRPGDLDLFDEALGKRQHPAAR